jgi:amino acid transporter
MAKDGYLPSMLQAKEGKPPVGSVLLQGAIALVILFTQNLQDILHDIGAVLTLFSALTAASLLWVCYKRRGSIAVSPVKMTAAVVFIISAAYMFYFGLQADTNLLLWIVLIVLVASFGYFVSRRFVATSKNIEDAPVLARLRAEDEADEET